MINGIGSWLVKHSDRFENKVALVSKDRRFTYAELNERVNRLANQLNKIGVREGDRVNVLLFNTNEILETMFACAKIGAIFVPINYRLSAREVEYIVRDSGGIIFIYDERLTEIVSELKKLVSHIHYYIKVGDTPAEEDLDFESFLQSGESREPAHVASLDDVYMMMYTSGTTGKPKGVMLTNGNTQWNTVNAISYSALPNDDITLTVAPLFHVGGMNIHTTPTLYIGGTVVLMDVFDPTAVLETIEKEKITTLFLVPAMWLAISHHPEIDNYDLSSIRLCVSGGAPCPIPVIEFFQERDMSFQEGFGLTETSPGVSILDEENSLRKHGSVGKPMMHIDVRVVDPEDRDVPVGEVGELIVKGPNIMVGYWNKPEETKEALRNGWFYTGDLAKMDEEGFLYIVDRKKDMIITGGENVYPIEVEQVLFRHSNIREVAVIGYPDEKWGESVKAFIALKNPDDLLTLDDIRDFCDGELARFKMPKKVEIVEELPRNATGKVLKTHLRSMDVEKQHN